VLLPARDRRWEVDVSRASHWLGRTWVEALADLGVAAAWHDGSIVSTPWSSRVCFAGLGPGEVTTPEGGKVVGISQRRRRTAARFQCAALLRWDPAALLDVLHLSAGERRRAGRDLHAVASAIPAAADDLEDAFVARIGGR
jgi:lipoate-protein ligase A